MLGFEAAKGVIGLGRQAFFQEGAPDLPIGRSPSVSLDDQVPQFGYIGSQYPRLRILFLGINPGNGPSNEQSVGDRQMIPNLRRFAENPTEENYDQAMNAYKAECVKWSVWKKHNGRLLTAGCFANDEIAYSNCLPWRTQSKSNFSDYTAEKAAKHYVGALIDDLKPRLIVAMGKQRPPMILKMTGLRLPQVIYWNRAQAEKAQVEKERAAALREIRKAVGRLRHE